MKLARLLSVRSFLHSGQHCRLHLRARGHLARTFGAINSHNYAIDGLFHLWLRRPTHSPQITPLLHLQTLSTALTTFADPSRPSVFYHLLPAPNPISADLPVYAVSLLNRPPKDVRSPAIMGWLPAAVRDGSGGEAGLGDFRENPAFLEVLHQVIQNAIDNGNDKRLKAEAIQLGQGWMHINDDRNLPEMGRISRPDDIIASVRVEGGEILPGTYNPMPTYRICTTDGLTKLSEGLEHGLLETLQRMEGE